MKEIGMQLMSPVFHNPIYTSHGQDTTIKNPK